MDRNTMKNTMKSLKLWVLGCVMLFAGVQNASAALKGCEGTVYLKLPDGWTTAFTAGGGNFDGFTKSTKYPSWYEISTAKIGGTNNADFFHISAARGDYGQAGGITRTQIGKNVQFQETTGFTCKDFGVKNELWIQPSFEDPTKPYVKGDPPDVKYFYVFLPDNRIWKSAVPMISEDGKEREMDIDNNNCGWYFRRYVDEPLPTKVFIHRDDDENLSNAIGFGGEKAANEGKAPEEINLKVLFEVYDQELGHEKKLYFVADAKKASELQGVDFGWYVSNPGITGSCMYFLAARIYDTDADLHPSFSCYKKDSRDNEEGCQGVDKQGVDKKTAAQGVDLNTARAAIKACIGVTPGIVESTLDKATKKPKLTAAGKKCFMDEKYFNQLFNYTQGVNEVTCYDMPFTRADDGKWEFDSDFYTSGGLARAAQGGFYPAESTTVEKLRDADSNQVAVPTARTKRWAQGPVFYGPALRELHPTEKIPLIDTYCNGPGWSGGHKCDSLFADGDGTTAAVGSALHLMAPNDCVFGWSCPDKAPADWQYYASGTDSAVAATATGADYRWDSDVGSKNGGRNQHFCFESHANFLFKKGLKFSFRGDDDIWVYIDNKLAVDLGGTHLAAPGYVDLDKFMPDAKPGSTYDIDIFFCDRRTTMSNVRIKTNMFIEQKTGIETSEFENWDEYLLTGDNKIVLTYAQSGGGSCAAAMGSTVTLVGEEITKAGHKITYMFTRDKSGTDPTKIEVSEEQFEANPVQYGGAIDVTELYAPVINEVKLKSMLPPNTYYLRVKINSDVYIRKIEVEGSVSVANRDAVIMNGAVASAPMKFKSSSIATSNDPAIEDLIPLYIAPSTDPCAGAASCTEYLKLNPVPGASYSLEVKDTNGVDIGDRNIVTFYKLENGKLSPYNPKVSHVIGNGGVDTVYATIQYGEFTTSYVEHVTINVKGDSRKAKLKFFVPKITFVESETSLTPKNADPTDYTRMRRTPYDFYLIALNPESDTPCGDVCNNIKLGEGSQLSKGVRPDSNMRIMNGRATITVMSELVFQAPDFAKLHVTGPNASLMQAIYTNLQFLEPPVPTPVIADIFDVHGELPSSAMNIPEKYFSMQTEYLDGIGDSVAIYYYRKFHKDSLPEKIAIFWDEDVKDSVVFEKAEIATGALCGAAAGLDDTLCAPRITLGGKKLSKKVKTSGKGKIKSWATYMFAGRPKTSDYECDLYDRIAPIIVSARAMKETLGGVELAKLKIEFSEPVQKTTEGVAKGDAVLSFYINNGKEPQFTEHIPLNAGSSIPATTNSNVMNLLYSPSSLFPQSGDYIHFGSIAGVGLFTDQSDYDKAIFGTDTLRPADDATYKWNVAPGYDASNRRPSPWVLISGEVNSYAVRLIPSAMGGIPKTPSEAAKYDAFEVVTYDASKDDDDFRADIRAGKGENLEKYGYIPHGWYVKTDMGALIESRDDYVNADKKNVFFDYELSFFTNLGAHVATNKGRIFCDDDKNYSVNGKYYFGGPGHNCVENRKNFYILWNMKSNKNRLVGSGAYISKLKTYVQLDNHGKKNKFEKREMWGVRHNAKTTGSFPAIKLNP